METLRRYVLSFSSPSWSVAGMPLTQQEVNVVMDQDTLLHEEDLFFIATNDLTT